MFGPHYPLQRLCLIVALTPLLFAGRTAAQQPQPFQLFDGKSFSGWTTQDGKPVTKGWEVTDGTIHLKKDAKRAGHIVTDRQFGDFRLSFQWAIAARGNSGLKYRVRKFGGKILGCEYQIFDDQKGKLRTKQSSASLYAVYEPNEDKQLKPAGEFNSAQIVVQGNKIEHWLNGKLVMSASVSSPQWDQRIAKSKFAKVQGFGRNQFGKLMLTDHGSEVWYRDFKFELLPMSDLQGDNTLTVGEQTVNEALGGGCHVLRLWPRTEKSDAQQKDGERVAKQADKSLSQIVRVSHPSILVLPPAKRPKTDAAILLCPGAGDEGLAIEPALRAARSLNAQGLTVVLLKYRLPPKEADSTSHQPLHDAQRAVGMLRARAAQWGIDPNKIGVGGIGSGGHLAALLATDYAKRRYESVDPFDQVSCRPNFLLLLQPSRLTEPNGSRKLAPHFSKDRITSKSAPPSLIATISQQASTIGSVEYYLALQDARVPSEIHVYDQARQGQSFPDQAMAEWAQHCYRFLGDQGVLKRGKRPQPFTYQAKSLPPLKPRSGWTLGDQRLAQILDRECPLISVWPEKAGPDETLQTGEEDVSARSRGGNALNIGKVTRPTLTVVRPKKKGDGTAVIVCPGGGYNGLAAEHEGTRVCQWLGQQGITAILLKYRVPRRGGKFPKHHQALQDLQRAMRLVRANAERWKIDPHKVGVCGFSAGGHLSAMLCTDLRSDAYSPIDEVDKLSSRPDFAVLIYPAYLTEPRKSNDVPAELKRLRKGVTPPIFMTVARDDPFARGMLNFLLEVRQQGIQAEAHVFAAGGHGGGMDPVCYPFSEWTGPCQRWLSRQRDRLQGGK